MDNLDIYASIPSFNFKGKTKYSSWFTFTTSLVFYAAFLGLFAYLSLELFNKEKPNVSNSFYSNPNPQRVNFSSSSDLFALQLGGPGGAPIFDQSLFYVRAEMITKFFSGSKKDEIKEIPTIPCEEYLKTKEIKEKVKDKDLSKFHCFDTDGLYLQGDWGFENFTYLRMKFLKCQGLNCKSQEEIDKALNRAYMTINYTNINFFPNDYSDPTPKYVAHYFTSTKPEAVKGVNIYYSPFTLESNIGLVMNDTSISTTLMFDKLAELESTRTDNQLISQYVIRLSTKQVRYTRVYLKLQKVLAEVGGLMNALRLIGMIFSYLYTKKLKFFLVADKIIQKPLKQTNNNNVNVSSTNLTDRQIIRDGVKPNFSVFSLIPGTKSNKQARDFMRKHNNRVERILDIKNLIKVLKEVELLKEMLLSPQQNALMSFFDNYFVENKFTELGYKNENDAEKLNVKDKAELEGYLASLQSSRNEDDKVLFNALCCSSVSRIAFNKD